MQIPAQLAAAFLFPAKGHWSKAQTDGMAEVLELNVKMSKRQNMIRLIKQYKTCVKNCQSMWAMDQLLRVHLH